MSGVNRKALLVASFWFFAKWLAPFEALNAAVLKPTTIEAFERYVKLTETRMEGELTNGNSFLWVDSQPEVQRRDLYTQLKQGQILIQEMKTLEDGRPFSVPDGLIHDWAGVVFIPGATFRQAEELVTGYDNYQNVYKLDIDRSKLLRRDGNVAKIYLRLRKKKVIMVVLNTEHSVQYFSIDSRRAHSRSYSTRIAEVEDPFGPHSREKPVGNDRGVLWRLNSYWRILETDNGTYLQIESISLSRDLPPVANWLIGSFIKSVHKEILYDMLRATRESLTQSSAGPTGRADKGLTFGVTVQGGIP
jgi:hypothetical protein